jgi:hypothetical protein
MEPKESLPSLQDFAISPYHKPDEFSPHTLTPGSLRTILILSSHLGLGLPSSFFSSSLSKPTINETRKSSKASVKMAGQWIPCGDFPNPETGKSVQFSITFITTFKGYFRHVFSSSSRDPWPK